MRILKQYPLLAVVNSYVVDSPQPSNLSYAWNFGSLLATCLGLQIVTGVFLAIHYTPHVELAFVSVEHIIRDVSNGWLLRYLHANGASFFFILVYLHVARGLYYGSYKAPRIAPWSIGVIILVLIIGIAFLGYVLPFGQISLWGATVITNILSAIPWIGQNFVEFVISFVGFKCDFNVMITSSILATSLRKTRGRMPPYTVDQLKEFEKIPASFIAIFTGIVDGDGMILINDNGNGYINITIVISLHLDDAPILHELRRKIKYLGVVYEYSQHKSARYILNRTELEDIIFPLIAYHHIFFLTNTRRLQFDKAIYVVNNNIIKYNNIPVVVPIINILPPTASGYLNLKFFNNWVVGFTIAEGSFNVKNTGEIIFNIKQRIHEDLFKAFRLLFNTTRKLYYEKNIYIQFSVQSKKDLETVVNFFSFSGLEPLIGLKLASYNKWLQVIRTTRRTSHIKTL